MSTPIVIDDLSVSFRSGPVLSGIDLIAQPARRLALVGENGSGKSTLLRAVAGRLPAYAQVSGTVQAPADLVYVAQEPPFRDDETIAQVLASTLRPLREAVAQVEALAARLDEAEVATRYAEVLDWAIAHDAWDADRRAALAADRLGLAALDQTRLIGSLSGGQRTRLALATAITRRPEALLLDEPTNHLDDAAIEVLADFLRDLPGVVLMASHDRVFLDEVATDLYDLDPTAFGTDGLGGRRFGGGWSEYAEARRAARARWEETYALQQEEIKALRAATRIGADAIAHNRGPRDNDKFIYGFKGANVDRALARRKKDAVRRLDDAEAAQVRKPRPPLTFRSDLTATAGVGRAVVVRRLEVAGRLSVPVLDLGAGDHLLVTGANGSGKSTLLGVLSGRIAPTSGEVGVHARRVAELRQDPDFPDLRETPAARYLAVLGAARAEELPLRALGLIHPRDLTRPLGALSVGQRRRLDLALAIGRGPDLLLLDEPTNHLSLTLAGELEEAIGASSGSVVVASHDRWLRRRWAGATLALSHDRSAALPD